MIVLNGTDRDDLDAPTTVTALLAALDIDGSRGIAVAVDSHVVPRGEWDSHEIGIGARVEVLTAVQGG